MGITAKSGPSIVFGQTISSTGAVGQYNEERGPSLYDLGAGIMDPRPVFNYQPGAAVGTKIYGFWDNAGLVDAYVSTAESRPGSIVSCATGSSLTVGPALTLNTSTITGNSYNLSITAPETGFSTTVPMGIDATTPYVAFGSGGTVNIWNPNNAVARNVVVFGTTNSSNDDSAVKVSVAGRDIYGFKMSETITMSSLSVTSPSTVTFLSSIAPAAGSGGVGQKAFKYITAISVTGTSQINSSSIQISWGQTYGFPVRIDTPSFITVTQVTSGSSGSASISGSSLNFIFALSTATAPTATTADVRGTWSPSTVWPTNNRLQMVGTLNPVNLATITSSSSTPYAGIFGMPQFSSV